MSPSGEAVVRTALRERMLADTAGARDAVDEFWVPRSHERADLAVIGRWMDGFEIKTEQDTLRRLPRQAEAYARVFDRCTVVVSERHSDAVADMLPDWWGITTVHVNGSVAFNVVRKPHTNVGVDPEVLVRLLWRDEALFALGKLGVDADQRAPRMSLWHMLLATATLAQLRQIVRRALVHRDPARARIATRRFTVPKLACVADP
jgi:hypothetical protein